MNTPSAAELKAARNHIGLSVAGMADALGYPGQERLIRALEVGQRDGEPFTMTGPATMALTYLRGIVKIVWRYQSGVSAEECMRDLNAMLPEELR